MNSYLDLIPISEKVHQKQNRLTLFCIAISVFLVTAIFSMAESGFRMEIARLSAKHEDISIPGLLSGVWGQTLIAVSSVLFLLVLSAGVFMISGSINSNIAQRTQFFGMMRCIGMSRRQVMKYVRLEALNWCKISIPCGIAAGIITTWGLCAALKYIVTEEFSEIEVFRVSPAGIIGGVSIGIISVLIAAGSPARKAGKISPIEARRGDQSQTFIPKKMINSGFGSVETRLGVSHAVGNGKNVFLTAGSFALSIILFLTFIVFIDLVDLLMPQSKSDPDITITSHAGKNDIEPSLLRDLSDLEGVRHVYGRQSMLDFPGDIQLSDYSAESADIISFGDYELECLAKEKSLQRGSDIARIYGDSPYVLAAWDPDNPLHIGDSLRVGSETLTIAGLLKNDPFNEDGLTHGKITLITSVQTFERITGAAGYQMVMVRLTANANEEEVKKIFLAAANTGKITDNREYSTKGTYTAFLFFVYGFLVIIALVAVLNIINNVSMTVTAKMKQYGAMRAVGMSIRQVIVMITAEAMTYALAGSVFGCLIGLALHRQMYRVLIENHFGFVRWQIPLGPLAAVTAFVFASVMLAVAAASHRIRKMSVTETINEL